MTAARTGEVQWQQVSDPPTRPLVGSNLCVVLPAAASTGRHGTRRMLLKRHFARKKSGPSVQSVMSILTSSLRQAHGCHVDFKI